MASDKIHQKDQITQNKTQQNSPDQMENYKLIVT